MSPLSRRNSVALLCIIHALLGCAAPLATGARAASWDDWQHQQEVGGAAAGLNALVLNVDSFRGAQPDLADLRLIDASGAEVPFVIDQPIRASRRTRIIQRPDFTIEARGTRMIIPITNAPALRSLTLQTPAPGFLKPITVEALADGGSARPIASRITFFRQRGVDRLSLDLPTLDASVRSLRITLDDSRSAPIPISAVVLEEEEIPTPNWMVLPLQAGDRLEGSGQSRINLQIGAAGIPIERMRFTTDEPVFARRIELMSREWGAQGLEDRPLASGSIHRLTFDAETRSESLEFTARFKAPAPEIVMVIENGDSPAMTFQRIEALWHPVRLLFHARSAGTFLLLSGNPQARSPRYDLGLLLGDARRATLQAVQPGPLTVRASFRPPSGLPEVPLFGGPLDATQWDFRRHLSLLGDGVHRLKLPLHTLAKARPDLSDVRLISGGRQLLYLIDRPLLQMPVALVAASAPVPRQPTLSRWKLELPMDGLAPTRIRCISVASLFDRSLRVYEEVQNPSGGKSPRILGQARWIRTPENPRSLLEIGLPGHVVSRTLWLETDNAENAPIELDQFEGFVPGANLLFQTRGSEPVELCYGNKNAGRPSYDLNLIAPQILASQKKEASVQGSPGDLTSPSAGRWTSAASWVFYGALVLVVGGLLWVIARLAPKSQQQ